MSNSDMASCLRPACERLTPRALQLAQRKWADAQIHSWITTHCSALAARPRKSLNPERLEGLRMAFELMDADNSGQIDFKELATAMRALGFGVAEIRETIRSGDVDGDGQLDFMEVSLEHAAGLRSAHARSRQFLSAVVRLST